MRKTIDQKILLDGRFTNLSPLGQHLWLILQLHPKTNALGVCDWTFKQLGAYTRGTTAEGIRQAGRELEKAGLVIIDDDTEEALILDHIDGTADSGTIESAYVGTASPLLRKEVAKELRLMLARGDAFPFDRNELSGILPETSESTPDTPPQNEQEKAPEPPKPVKKRRGKPRKHVPQPVELTDGTMEPPFGEPMTMAQVENLPQRDDVAPVDLDDAGNPRYVRWEDVPEQLWFYHPLPDDWKPDEDASRLYTALGGGGKMTLSEAAQSFRILYEKELYAQRPNGFKAAWLSPNRLFMQQLLHWRRDKDEEDARKAQKPDEEGDEPVLEPESPSDTKLDGDDADVQRRKRMVPRDWAPNQHHRDKAKELNLDVGLEAEKFYDYSHANGKKYLSFDRAFNVWLLNADRFRRNEQTGFRKTRSEEGYEHNMNMLKNAIAQAGWGD